MAGSKNNLKRNTFVQLLSGLVIIVALNIIGSYVYTRIDLTSEKRYTLSDATLELLENLDDYVYFRVYLEGDFPAGFKRLKNETREMLDEFRAYTHYIDYTFINPSESNDPRKRNDTYRLLAEKGLQPTDLHVKTNDGMSKNILFPGALVSYKANEVPLELLRTQIGVPPEEVLNNSIQSLEFNLANTIRKLTQKRKPSVAIIQGHGELERQEIADFGGSLMDDYHVDVVVLNGKLNSLAERTKQDSLVTGVSNKYDAIVIAKPDSAFSERDKFIIDQYIMRGGKVLWLVDPVFASMDSIEGNESTMGIKQELNLDDILFNYGVRLNSDLILDINALPIPLTVGRIGDQPQIEFFPWYYFPLLTPLSQHPVVNNLNLIKTEFISSIDTVNIPGIKKTILLKTSPYSRRLKTPVFIDLGVLRDKPDQKLYNEGPFNVAVLLEGAFESHYKNRIPRQISEDKDIDFMEVGLPAKMIVAADGDIVKNQFHVPNGFPLPLGYDQYTGETFGNKEFALNAMNYLVDESGLISIRSRDVKLRLLDNTVVSGNRLLIQILNTTVPSLLVMLLGLFLYFRRRRKYKSVWK